jgi:hypothetical protein
MKKLLLMLLATLCYADAPLFTEVSEHYINYRLIANGKTIVWSSRIKIIEEPYISYGSVDCIISINNKISYDFGIKDSQTENVKLIYFYKF